MFQVFSLSVVLKICLKVVVALSVKTFSSYNKFQQMTLLVVMYVTHVSFLGSCSNATSNLTDDKESQDNTILHGEGERKTDERVAKPKTRQKNTPVEAVLFVLCKFPPAYFACQKKLLSQQ